MSFGHAQLLCLPGEGCFVKHNCRSCVQELGGNVNGGIFLHLPTKHPTVLKGQLSSLKKRELHKFKLLVLSAFLNVMYWPQVGSSRFPWWPATVTLSRRKGPRCALLPHRPHGRSKAPNPSEMTKWRNDEMTKWIARNIWWRNELHEVNQNCFEMTKWRKFSKQFWFTKFTGYAVPASTMRFNTHGMAKSGSCAKQITRRSIMRYSGRI